MRSSLLTVLLATALSAAAPRARLDADAPAPSPAPPPAAHDGTGARSGHAEHGEGRHGNPSDIESYIAHQEEPGRAEWQKPDDVVKALALLPGETVCDVGAGPGYFSLRLARALGESGQVYAVDVEPRMTEALRERLGSTGARNVTPVLSLPDDPLLADSLCDLVLVVDTYHHFDDGAAYLRRLLRTLRPRGRVVNIDFHKRPTPVGPALEHRVSREAFLDDAARAGYALEQEHDFLPYQYFLVLRPR